MTMRTCCVKIGYRVTEEQKMPDGITGNGIWVEKITERRYKGELVKDYSRNTTGESVNDNVTLSNNIAIVANKYALSNFTSIIYCEWMGQKLKVNSIDATNYPRLVLTLGGEYHERPQ